MGWGPLLGLLLPLVPLLFEGRVFSLFHATTLSVEVDVIVTFTFGAYMASVWGSAGISPVSEWDSLESLLRFSTSFFQSDWALPNTSQARVKAFERSLMRSMSWTTKPEVVELADDQSQPVLR